MKKITLGDFGIVQFIVAIGTAEVAHLAGTVLGFGFAKCAVIWALLWAVVFFGCCGLAFLQRKKWFEEKQSFKEKRQSVGTGSLWGGRAEGAVWVLFGLVVLSQILFVFLVNPVYRQGDMTVETVGSFLATDGIYRVNPLTGQPYAAGIPLRLKILCLPTLYGSICSLTGLEPVLVVQKFVPVLVLLGSYVAFGELGKSLFGEDTRKRSAFMLTISLLIWAGAYVYSMDGFGLLCSGFRGVTIRNLILVPWTFALCIRRKWLGVILCVLGEACIVWTLYGMGVCLLVAAGMLVSQVVCARIGKNEPSAEGGNV